MFTITLVFERPTKRTVRFCHEDFGVVYIPNDVYRELGEPKALSLTLTPHAQPELKAA